MLEKIIKYTTIIIIITLILIWVPYSIYIIPILYLFSFILIYIIRKRKFKKMFDIDYKFKKYTKESFKFFIKTITIFMVIFWLIVFISPMLFPVKTDKVILEKDWKTIVLQWMAYIWKEEYYNNIKKDIKKYTNEKDYIYMYEAVKAKDKDNYKILEKQLGVFWNPKKYLDMFSTNEMVAQDQLLFNSLVKDKENIVNADVYIEDMIVYYNSNKDIKNGIIPGIDISQSKIITSMKKENEKWFLRNSYNKFLLNTWMQISPSIINIIWKDNFMNKVVIEFRNDKLLSDFLLNEDYKESNLYVTYWNIHLPWIIEALKEEWFTIKEKTSLTIF